MLRLQKSPCKQKNYSPVGFSDRHGHPCSNPQEFLPLTRYGQKYSFEMQHWDAVSWQEKTSLNAQQVLSLLGLLDSRAQVLIQLVVEGLPFLSSGLHINTSEWMELGLLLAVAVPVFSLLGRILVLGGSAMAKSRASEASLLGFEPRSRHLPSQGPGAKHLCSALQFPPRWKDTNSTNHLRWLWGLNEMWPIKRQAQHIAHGKHLIFLVWSLSKYNLQSMPHRRGVPCLGLTYTQDAAWFAGHKQTPHPKGWQKDFYLGCICKRASCTPRAASCVWERATTVPEPHAGLLPEASSSFSRGRFPSSLEVGMAQEHMTTSWGPCFRALQLGTH